MEIPPLETRHRLLIETVAGAFAEIDQWPHYPYVEAVLDHDHDLAFADVIGDIPPGMVWSPSGYGPQAEIRTSVTALAAVNVQGDDLERFVKLVGHAAERESALTSPGRSSSRISASSPTT